MAKLTAKARGGMRASTFGLPGQRKYPMPDESHAANAKARATQMFKRGRLTAAQRSQINRKADKILSGGRGRGARAL